MPPRAANPSGRHRKFGLTIADAWDKIIGLVQQGIPIVHAVEFCGFAKTSLYEWVERYPEAREEMEQAKAEGELRLVHGLYEAAARDPRFGLEMLSRRRTAEWGKQDRVEVTGKDGGPIESSSLTRGEALDKLAAMASTNPEIKAALAKIVRDTPETE